MATNNGFTARHQLVENYQEDLCKILFVMDRLFVIEKALSLVGFYENAMAGSGRIYRSSTA